MQINSAMILLPDLRKIQLTLSYNSANIQYPVLIAHEAKIFAEGCTGHEKVVENNILLVGGKGSSL